jgi:hypothetical protein
VSAEYETGKNRIMIYGPKDDGMYWVEFRKSDGESLAISVPASETRVLKYFQDRMPMGWSSRTMLRDGSHLLANATIAG